jgi:hypothetical protein
LSGGARKPTNLEEESFFLMERSWNVYEKKGLGARDWGLGTGDWGKKVCLPPARPSIT